MPRLRALPLVALALGATTSADELRFTRTVIDANFPGAYQVETADVNGDGKPDVIAVGGGTCAWYENPTWTKRIVTGPKQSPGIISSATADLDGDGKAEIAIAYEFAMTEPKKGKLLIARQGPTSDAPWSTTPVADVGSIHRLRWGKFVAPDASPPDLRLALAVAPIFGRSATPPKFDEEPARLEVFYPGREKWTRVELGPAPVAHAIDVLDFFGEGHSDVLSASNRGITAYRSLQTAGAVHYQPIPLVSGAPGEVPKKGCSEVHVGKLKDGRRFLAAVEPWHGTDVAVYFEDAAKPGTFGARTVIDTSLKDGHALWVADVDGDGDSEVFAGYRGAGTSVLAFDFNGQTWDRTVVDNQIAAQDLRGADLDADGTPDVVAVGGATKNVVWYKPVRSK